MIGIFGGTFDPPHFGHIKSALALLEYYPFKQIRFVPCQLSPHKSVVHASAKHRMQMLNLVCDGVLGLYVDDRELNKPPPSYTIDTLIEIREELGDQEPLVLILGMDAYATFCRWHRYDEILLYSHLLLLRRPGYELSDMDHDTDCERNYLNSYQTDDIDNLTGAPSGKIFISKIEKINISSTEIRKIISSGDQPKYVIPGNIWNYIRRHNLYKSIT